LRIDKSVEKSKLKLVTKGFKQEKKSGFFNTYALIYEISTIRLLVSLAFLYRLEIQIDGKMTFFKMVI
jgi:hypothetical protein